MVEIKKFNIPCFVNGQSSVVGVYLGQPKEGNNPVHHQSVFLAQERGIIIPDDVLETLEKIRKIAERNGVSFIELCDYAFKSLQIGKKTQPEEGQTQTAATNVESHAEAAKSDTSNNT